MNRFAQYGGAGTAFSWEEANGYGRQPFSSLTVGPFACIAAGPDGVAIGAFCWVDPDTGEANNLQSEGALLGFVLPLANQHNLWERVYMRSGWPFAQQIIRPGIGCGVAQSGVFSPKFPNGGLAGTQVFADPASGLPYSGNQTGGYVATAWTLAQSGGPGCRLRMSSFLSPFQS